MVNRMKNSRDREKKRGFVYTKRDPKKMEEHASQQGGSFDSIFITGVDSWRPKVGDNDIRILPPTWDEADHFSYEIYVHSYVGADGSTYLCPKKMKGDHCPLCAAAAEAKAAGEEAEAKQLNVKKSFLCYILDRKGDDPEKPVVWQMGWTLDRDIALACKDRTTGKVMDIDDPDNGYDIYFKRTGQKLNTRYIGIQVNREDSPILEREKDQEEVLADIADRPIPSLLKYYDEAYLEKVVDGTAERKSEEDDDGDKDDRSSRRRGRDDDDDKGERTERVGRKSRDDKDDKGDDDDDRGSRRRGRDDKEDDDKEDRGSRRRGRDDKEDDDISDKDVRRRGRDDKDEKDDDDRGSRRRGRDADDDDDKERSSSRRRDREEKDPADDDEKDPEKDTRSSRRREKDDDKDDKEDDDRGSRRSRDRDDDDKEDKPRGRGRDDDDDKPRGRGRDRDRDDDDKGKGDDDDRGSRTERVRRR